jgi:hypothetical protein
MLNSYEEIWRTKINMKKFKKLMDEEDKKLMEKAEHKAGEIFTFGMLGLTLLGLVLASSIELARKISPNEEVFPTVFFILFGVLIVGLVAMGIYKLLAYWMYNKEKQDYLLR